MTVYYMKKLKVYISYQTFLGTSFAYCLRGIGKGLSEITKKHENRWPERTFLFYGDY